MVLGMRYDSSFDYAMAGLYRAAVAVSALVIFASAAHAADPPVPRSNVSVNVNPTTGYYSSTNSTLRLPNGVSTAPTSGLPVVTKYSGGLQQTIPTGVTIDAIKKSAPLPAVVRSSTQTLKRAATGCLRSAKCNVPLILAGEGLNKLFDGLDWVMGEGGKIQKKVSSLNTYEDYLSFVDSVPRASSCSDCTYISYTGAPNWRRGQMKPEDVSSWLGGSHFVVAIRGGYSGGQVQVDACAFSNSSGNMFSYTNGSSDSVTRCYYANRGTDTADLPFTQTRVPVSDSEIESGVNSNYEPEPSDWRALTPEMQPDDIEITSAPTLQGEPITKTVYDAEGNPHKVTQTNIWYDFDIRDNPSPRPALDLKTREETETYEDGVLTSTTTTESTASGGSGSSPESQPESPIDCDLFPTACAWFDWTQEEPTEPDDDLSGLLQEVPIVSETYTITGGAAVCPAPMVLDLSVFGSREVSYQPLCDLAITMKYLYLALMSFAAAVLLNRSVNRV